MKLIPSDELIQKLASEKIFCSKSCVQKTSYCDIFFTNTYIVISFIKVLLVIVAK